VLALLFGFDLLQAVEFAEQRAPLWPFFYTIFIFRRAVLSLFIDWTRVYFWGVGFLKLCDAK